MLHLSVLLYLEPRITVVDRVVIDDVLFCCGHVYKCCMYCSPFRILDIGITVHLMFN
jgi:chromosome condensin MukBEF MukE localization factor